MEIQSPGGVASTFDEAATLARYARRNTIRNVIVVTNEFHSRRARWIFSQGLKRIRSQGDAGGHRGPAHPNLQLVEVGERSCSLPE